MNELYYTNDGSLLEYGKLDSLERQYDAFFDLKISEIAESIKDPDLKNEFFSNAEYSKTLSIARAFHFISRLLATAEINLEFSQKPYLELIKARLMFRNIYSSCFDIDILKNYMTAFSFDEFKKIVLSHVIELNKNSAKQAFISSLCHKVQSLEPPDYSLLPPYVDRMVYHISIDGSDEFIIKKTKLQDYIDWVELQYKAYHIKLKTSIHFSTLRKCFERISMVNETETMFGYGNIGLMLKGSFEFKNTQGLKSVKKQTDDFLFVNNQYNHSKAVSFFAIFKHRIENKNEDVYSWMVKAMPDLTYDTFHQYYVKKNQGTKVFWKKVLGELYPKLNNHEF